MRSEAALFATLIRRWDLKVQGICGTTSNHAGRDRGETGCRMHVLHFVHCQQR